MIGVVGAVIGCAVGLAWYSSSARSGIDFGFASGMGEVTALMGTRLYPSRQPRQRSA